jgi:aminopeptidase N
MGTPADGLIISKNKFGDRTFFADNWPNRAHQWIPCIDRPDDKASFEFYVTAPDHYQVISNGIRMEEKKLDQGRKLTHWKEDIALPTKVMVIGVARFAVKNYTDSPANIPVSAWVYPQDSTKGFYDYGVAPGIVRFFTDYFAPFPYKKLANVQSKTIFGGMENAGAIFYAEQSVTGDRKWEEVLSHEIVHQWFGDMASEKSFAHLWLSEGFATYFTDLYFEKKYSADSARKRLQKERTEVEAFVKKNGHAVVDSTSDLMSLLNENSYQKGGWVLHMLRIETGDSIFKKIIREYYQAFKGGNADTRDFEKVAERVSGKDLKWFFDQWLYQGGIPELDIKTDVDKEEVKVKIKQGNNLYRFVMEVGLLHEDGTMNLEKMEIREREVEYKWKERGVKKVLLDPQTRLLYMKK